MGGILNFALISVVLVLFIASLWYFFQTIRVMWRYNFLVAIIALGIVASVAIPNLEYQDLGGSMNGSNTEINNDAESEPWDWDIRAEDLE